MLMSLFDRYIITVSDCFTLQIDSVFKTYDKFFELSPAVKQKYAKIEGISPNGWDALERERCVTSCFWKYTHNHVHKILLVVFTCLPWSQRFFLIFLRMREP